MNSMKRLFGALLALLLVAAWPARAYAVLHVVTSFPQDAAIARAVGGQYVQVTSLARANNDPHAVQPRPSFAVALNRADLLIVNGQDMDLVWLPTALANARNAHILDGEDGYLDPSEGVHLIPYSSDELRETPFFHLNLIAGAAKAGGGKYGLKRGNHHYWLDPENGIIVAHNIAEKLSDMDKGHAEEFQANATRLEAALRGKMKIWDAEMAPFKGTPVVSYHRDWIYLIERHDLHLVGYVEPRETIPPSAGEVANLVLVMRKKHVRVVMTSPWQNQRIATEVARQAGAVNVVLPSTVGAEVGVSDYVNLFDVVYGRLIAALKSAGG